VISQKTSRQNFHSNEHKCVEKNILLKNSFHLKDDKNYFGGFRIKNSFYMFIKILDEILKKLPQDISKYNPKKKKILA
jgi:hypothetical protein